jgi:hypothetical protein
MTRVISKYFEFLTLVLLNPVEIKKYRQRGFENHFYFHIFILNLIYCFFSLIFAFYTFSFLEVLAVNMGMTLQFVQTVVPSLNMFYLSMDFLKNVKIDLSLKLQKSCAESIKSSSRSKILVCLSVLMIVRAIKLFLAPFFQNFIYALCTMMPELVASMSDFAFAFYVDNLTNQIKKFNDELRLQQIDWKVAKEVEKALSEFHRISQDICRVYSSRLFVTLSYNFVQLVIALFWIFIRIAFNHLYEIDGFASFLYIVQPILCFSIVFQSVQNCLDEVIQL